MLDLWVRLTINIKKNGTSERKINFIGVTIRNITIHATFNLKKWAKLSVTVFK
jgi:hypothetical protein